MSNTFFQKSVQNKYLNSQDRTAISIKWQLFRRHFQNAIIQENIRRSKEEQYQGEFLIDLFVNIFGYTKNPAPYFNLTTEYKNAKDSRKADGAIIINGKVTAVIELKGINTTDLTKVETQAFGYKNNQPECVYIITSNFEKLRFYIENATEYLEFNLFTLTEEDFALLYLCLSYDNIFKNLPKIIKEESVSKEKEITKKLYFDYSLFKRELYQSLVLKNSSLEPLLLFKKSQKLLDRFLFLFFAEDRQLLPPNSVRLILNDWRDLQDRDEDVRLYDRFKKYFNYLNLGFKGKRYDVFAYNGGLFKPDEILDIVNIDDELLYRHTFTLSEYNFQSEVDVNILGHIFENSLNELDEIKAKLEGLEFDKSNTKQKKDGVFYTPKYITKYIVDNTIGKLCLERKVYQKIIEEDYTLDRRRQKRTIQSLVDNLTEYRKWLLQLTICDPSCGSGAFLNQALDYLINEHRYIDELQAKLFSDTLLLSDVEKSILENNLFGVDLNEESVEIAKLSLWLRTAKTNRKLNDLNNNIKCGNSLISDANIAGKNAFDWLKEFPHIFERGGFDVIIGNPPYVGEKGHSNIFEDLKKVPKWNGYYRRRSNTYYFFIKHGIDLLKDGGVQSLIVPREFTNADWANNVRKEVLEESKIVEIVDFNNLKVFDDVGTTSLILTQKKEKVSQYTFRFKALNNYETLQNVLFDKLNHLNYDVQKLKSDTYKPWNFNSFEISYSNFIVPLGEVFDISQGLVTGADKVTNKHVISKLISEDYLGRGIFILNKNKDIKWQKGDVFLKINNDWILLDEEDKNFIKLYYKPEHLKKWFIHNTDTFVIYVGQHNLTEKIKDYLLQFDKILLNRSTINENKVITLKEFLGFSTDEIKQNYSSAGAVQKIMRQKKWYLPLYERRNVPFESSKIVVNTKNMDVFTFSDQSFYSSGGGSGGQNFIFPNSAIIDKIKETKTNSIELTMYVNAILNSSLLQYYIVQGQFNQLSTEKIADLPLYLDKSELSNEKSHYFKIIEKCKILIELSKKSEAITHKFYSYLSSKFVSAELSKLKAWQDCSFPQFVDELNKTLRATGLDLLSKKEEFEWMDLFNENVLIYQDIQTSIKNTEDFINDLIFSLYKLSKQEIYLIKTLNP
ncbi:HsdM family class I SAM-dependent methyltransferase [Mucilaginibacter ginkgonis]|uniref:site-specific DNA-methyltransferase (adenine-specific) n=1 Tax=Mucilaginibacter ginkgonis TaxID=2682091 RepID=A0A6I4I0W8_9SPHI|nr:N-6 DNA methylase [Mucilaginibacter ginkgonis]QQL51214.1 N-6 DNA methylase [Mucilaginibacter ginkgonis]